MRRRSVRLYWVAGLGIALGLGVLPEARAAQSVATETTLNVGTSDRGGHTFAAVTVNVADEYGLPATGAVDIDDGDRMLARLPRRWNCLKERTRSAPSTPATRPTQNPLRR
jgi:hypothetical protein